MSRRLNRREIVIMRSLFQRGAAIRCVTLACWMRKSCVPLWRKGLVEIWYRQSLSALEGPFYSLTTHGAYFASMFFPAPRGLSGAEPVR